jgi:hypothetical protein
MDFDITPEEARTCAGHLVEHLKGSGGKLAIEKAAWEDAPYRTTVFLRSGEDRILYEVQGHLSFHERLANFAQWIHAQRKCAELNVVTYANSPTTAVQFNLLKKYGVGLLLLTDDDRFERSLAPRNPALQVTPDPNLKYGEVQSEVASCVTKFNDGGRKDGLRDLCELVERETEKVLLAASRKRWTTLSELVIKAKDWSDQINSLASKGIMAGGREALIDGKLKDDLHSFRGARNLVDHQARTKREDQRRQRQFPERMMMGARLVADLVSLRRRIK